jgi:hypothetical protein
MEIIPDSYGKRVLNSAPSNLIISEFNLIPMNMFSCSQTGVDKLAKLIKQNGWTEEAGALTVWPAAADRKKFEDCLPHFLASRVVEQSYYSKEQTPSELLLQCALIQKRYQG